jgi:putative ABC transport system substrate-binding protein
MTRRGSGGAIAAMLGLCLLVLVPLGATVPIAEAQEGKVQRVGVILPGGPYYAAIDGLREGLKELGLEDGKQYVLEMRDVKGDLKAVGEAAREFERGKVALLYAFPTSVVTIAKRATTQIPIVFIVGSDPVARGLVESFPKPGGRLTGVHYWVTDLTPKRLEVLKDILPKLRRVVTFYDPTNAGAQQSAKLAREAGQRLRVNVDARHVNSVEELQAGLRALKPGEADAIFPLADAMVLSQAQLIIDVAKAKRFPTIFYDRLLVAQGALASYGVNYREIGRMSAKYVQRVLAGTSPQDLPVENAHRVSLAVNLGTAKALGLRIPNAILDRADQVIQ